MGSVAYEPEALVFDPSPLFSRRVQRWEPGAIRSLLPLEAIPGMISLVAGKPNPDTFPFSKISITVNGPEEKTLVLEGAALSEALQYGPPAGHPGLLKWFSGLQQAVHGISNSDSWTCCVGNGSQEIIHKAFQVFTDPGDAVMLETPAYPGVSSFLRADGHELVEVASGAEGVDPSDLERVLSAWPEHRPLPKVLYTVPTGSNPTGRSCSETNKARILALAKRFNFMIFEDDAYFFLNFEEDQSKRARSYLALEQEVNGETGRVMRFESLSKIVSSGMRLGILTGPTPAVQKVVKITENVNLQPSSTTQVLALTLFRHWGYTGFVEHCAKAAEFYRRKRDAFAAAADRHLQGRATWEVPTAGMFFWMKLLLPSGTDSFEILSKKGIDNKILAIPGMAFLPNARKACQLRASYSLVSEPDMDEACRRIAKLVDDAWRDEFANSAKSEAQAPVPTTTMKIAA
jgi:tryptophan aminotransferase